MITNIIGRKVAEAPQFEGHQRDGKPIEIVPIGVIVAVGAEKVMVSYTRTDLMTHAGYSVIGQLASWEVSALVLIPQATSGLDPKLTAEPSKR